MVSLTRTSSEDIFHAFIEHQYVSILAEISTNNPCDQQANIELAYNISIDGAERDSQLRRQKLLAVATAGDVVNVDLVIDADWERLQHSMPTYMRKNLTDDAKDLSSDQLERLPTPMRTHLYPT